MWVINQERKQFGPSARAQMCGCRDLLGTIWDRYNTMRCVDREKARRKWCKSEPKRERELFLQLLTQTRSNWETHSGDVGSVALPSFLWGEKKKKNPLTSNPSPQTNHVTSVTHLLRSAEAAVQLRTRTHASFHIHTRKKTYLQTSKRLERP